MCFFFLFLILIFFVPFFGGRDFSAMCIRIYGRKCARVCAHAHTHTHIWTHTEYKLIYVYVNYINMVYVNHIKIIYIDQQSSRTIISNRTFIDTYLELNKTYLVYVYMNLLICLHAPDTHTIHTSRYNEHLLIYTKNHLLKLEVFTDNWLQWDIHIYKSWN